MNKEKRRNVYFGSSSAQACDPPAGPLDDRWRVRPGRIFKHAERFTCASGDTTNVLQAACQACDFPVYERWCIACRHVRSKANAREVRRQADARPADPDSTQNRQSDEVAVCIQEVWRERYGVK